MLLHSLSDFKETRPLKRLLSFSNKSKDVMIESCYFFIKDFTSAATMVLNE